MLHAGLDLSRHRLDVHLMDQAGALVEATAVPPDADGLRGLTRRVAALGQPVQAATRVDERRPVHPRPA
jgi:transposase